MVTTADTQTTPAAKPPTAGSLHADHYRPAVCCFNCDCFTAASWSPSEERLGQCSVPGHGAVSAFHTCDRFPTGTQPREAK